MTPAELSTWNAAALQSLDSELPGDQALTSMLLAHGLVQNGGVVHAISVLEKSGSAEAAQAFRYFGLPQVAELFEELVLRLEEALSEDEEDRLEHTSNRRYWSAVPDDATLEVLYLRRRRSAPYEFMVAPA